MVPVIRDRGLIETALASAYLKPAEPAVSPELLVNIAATNDVNVEPGDSGLVDIVAGCRALRTRLEQIELEAARQARAAGTTVRELATATGMSERRANDRYRRST